MVPIENVLPLRHEALLTWPTRGRLGVSALRASGIMVPGERLPNNLSSSITMTRVAKQEPCRTSQGDGSGNGDRVNWEQNRDRIKKVRIAGAIPRRTYFFPTLSHP